MTELTIEQKAKRYEEALERARELSQTTTGARYEYIFPELAESKEEKIRKAIYGWIYTRPSQFFDNGFSKAEMLAWIEKQGQEPKKVSIWKHWKDGICGNGEGKLIYLIKNGDDYSLSSSLGYECDYIELSELDNLMLEKQCGQMPADKVEPKFEIEKGKWYVCNTSRYTDFVVGKAYYCPKNGMLKPNENEMARYVARHYFHLWAIQDAKPSDVLVDVYGNIGIFKQYDDFDWTSYCSLGINGGFQHFEVEHENEKTYPATKEQREQLEKAMADAGYTFDFEKKELNKIEQIPAWSEEDEMFVHGLIRGLAAKRDIHGHTTFSSDCIDITEAINWLKSLKERCTWKPSDEQIVALEHFVRSIGESGYASIYENNTKLLYSLLNDLKKLKG